MEIDDRLLKEVRRFTYAAWAVAAGLLLVAGAVAYSFIQTASWSESIYTPGADPAKGSPCAVDRFFREASALQERGKFKELIAFADARLKECPADHYAWWFKAKALAIDEQWDEALEALKHAELLRPDWRRPYVTPLRESIEWNKAKKKTLPAK